MGLAAGQARLLSITSRKSDCEFQSMRLSHQKIALSRELADLSNEYQNSLDQTKLVYDYYGTGDTNTPLTYGLLMTPSALNDYIPIILTDTSGRVTLNSKYAAAARAAGIPQEGLGTLPSETMRNAFVNGLAAQGLITDRTASTILGLPYNQGAGFGGDTTVALITESGNINDLIEYFNENSSNTFLVSPNTDSRLYREDITNSKGNKSTAKVCINTGDGKSTDDVEISLANLLKGDTQYVLDYEGIKGEQTPVIGLGLMTTYLTGTDGFIDWLYDEFSSVLDLGDENTGAALEYALTETKAIFAKTDATIGDTYYDDLAVYWGQICEGSEKSGINELDHATSWDDDKYNLQKYVNGVSAKTKDKKDPRYDPSMARDSYKYLGFNVVRSNQENLADDGNDRGTAAINLNNIARAFLTYFADYMYGVDKTDANGIDKYYVNKGSIEAENRLVTDDLLYTFTWATGTEVSSDDLGQAVFYDTLFNQICANGWTEDGQIGDKDYLQQMLQSGKLYLSRVKDDGYYYQVNYGTDSYIKEVADETYIAQAEAKYNTEKEKLNSKEETLDLKMKNLDTEISSLTTEYDTVKNTISKNIEKSFKRYNA